MAKRKNKYNAVRSMGYDSMAEREYGEVLELLLRAGEIKAWQHHPPAVELFPGTKWKIDFLVIANNRKQYYVEVKGMETSDYRIKLNWWKQNRPAPLLVVKKAYLHHYKVLESIDMDKIDVDKLTG